MRTEINADVAIIGAGPAGLTAAKRLRERAGAKVVVLEREHEAGGIPRHSDHPGYGIRDRKTFISGPRYARVLAREAAESGADILTGSMVTHWEGSQLAVTSPDGLATVSAQAVLLATGARERPRSARLVPGSRPAGVFTTGELQNAVHVHHQKVGKRAVVVGGELVSWSAVMTLKEAGCATEALVTRYRQPESYGVFNLGGRVAFRPGVLTSHRVTRIIGRHQVTGVEVEELSTGRRREVECDTVVFTGDWIPDNELARAAGLRLDAGTKGPVVDALGRTDQGGIFAAGNMVHPVDTADIAALGGRHVADTVGRYLDGTLGWREPSVPIVGGDPFAWVSPNLFIPGLTPARGRIQTWVHSHIRVPKVTVKQDGRVLARRTLPWPASPGRVFRIPSGLLDGARPDGGPIELSL